MRLQLPVPPVPPEPVAGRPARSGRVVAVAHRGASAEAPENTLAAIRRAVELGVDMVELDVRRTRDGALVLMHDTTLVRTTDVRQVFPGRWPWRVADFTLDELARLDAGSWKSPRFAGERVPTLQQSVDVLREARTGLLLEVKAPQLYPGLVPDLVTALGEVPGYVDEEAAAGRIVVQSFDFLAMKELRTLAPQIPVGLLGQPQREHLAALGTWAGHVNPSHLAVGRGYVEQVQAAGMACLAWTVDGGFAMRRALRLGVDGIITNRPGTLAKVLAEASAAA